MELSGGKLCRLDRNPVRPPPLASLSKFSAPSRPGILIYGDSHRQRRRGLLEWLETFSPGSEQHQDAIFSVPLGSWHSGKVQILRQQNFANFLPPCHHLSSIYNFFFFFHYSKAPTSLLRYKLPHCYWQI